MHEPWCNFWADFDSFSCICGRRADSLGTKSFTQIAAERDGAIKAVQQKEDYGIIMSVKNMEQVISKGGKKMEKNTDSKVALLEKRIEDLDAKIALLESKGITSIERLQIEPEDTVIVRVYTGKTASSRAMELVREVGKTLKLEDEAKEVFFIPVSYEEALLGCHTSINVEKSEKPIRLGHGFYIHAELDEGTNPPTPVLVFSCPDDAAHGIYPHFRFEGAVQLWEQPTGKDIQKMQELPGDLWIDIDGTHINHTPTENVGRKTIANTDDIPQEDWQLKRY